MAWSGVGKRRTVATLEALAAAGVEEVVHLGCAGGLRPAMRAGDAFWIESVASTREEEVLALSSEDPLRERLAEAGLQLASASCVTVHEVASTPEAKRELATRYPEAALVEMETYWAAQAAARLGLRLVALRVVVDARDHALPDLSSALDDLGRPKPAAFAKRLLRSPRTALRLPGVAKAFGAAQRSLGELANVLLQE